MSKPASQHFADHCLVQMRDFLFAVQKEEDHVARRDATASLLMYLVSIDLEPFLQLNRLIALATNRNGKATCLLPRHYLEDQLATKLLLEDYLRSEISGRADEFRGYVAAKLYGIVLKNDVDTEIANDVLAVCEEFIQQTEET